MPSSPENALYMCEQESDVVYHETHSGTFQHQYRGYNEKDMEVLIVETKVSLLDYMCLKTFADAYIYIQILRKMEQRDHS
jgi:hypothetical protein